MSATAVAALGWKASAEDRRSRSPGKTEYAKNDIVPNMQKMTCAERMGFGVSEAVHDSE